MALVSGAFEFAAPATLEIKGKPHGVRCWRLDRAISLMRPRGLLASVASSLDESVSSTGHSGVTTASGDSAIPTIDTTSSKICSTVSQRSVAWPTPGLVAQCDEICRTLTTHHRLHGAAMWLELHELCAGWSEIVDRRPITEEAVRANGSTPCVRNARSLLVTALGCLHTGDAASAASLEAEATTLELSGHGLSLDGPRIRVALARGDLARVEDLLAVSADLPRPSWSALQGAIACLDGFAALQDIDRLEREAVGHLQPNTLLLPFAQRALGIVREDESLVDQAITAFDAMGLAWYAEETRRLAAHR